MRGGRGEGVECPDKRRHISSFITLWPAGDVVNVA